MIMQAPDGTFYQQQPDGSWLPVSGQAPAQPSLASIATNIVKDKAEDVVKDQVVKQVLPNATEMGPTPGFIPAAVIASTMMAGKAGLDMLQGEKANPVGRGQLALTTMGLSELANMTGLGGLLGHKSTRDVAKEHTKELVGQGKDNQAWQNYVAAMRKQYESAPTDPTKPFAGKYGSWDEYKTAGLEAADLTGVYGNMKTFGPEWANYSFDDQKKMTQALIDADQYESKKGEVIVRDAEKAKQIGLAALAQQQPRPAELPKGSEGMRDAMYLVGRDGPGLLSGGNLSGLLEKIKNAKPGTFTPY